VAPHKMQAQPQPQPQPQQHIVPAYLSQWYDIECQIGEGTVRWLRLCTV
jgi:hypothetical protein